MSGESIKIAVTVKVGDSTFTVVTLEPLVLSGDRRRWARQITEKVTEQASLVGLRFKEPYVQPNKPATPATW